MSIDAEAFSDIHAASKHRGALDFIANGYWGKRQEKLLTPKECERITEKAVFEAVGKARKETYWQSRRDLDEAEARHMEAIKKMEAEHSKESAILIGRASVALAQIEAYDNPLNDEGIATIAEACARILYEHDRVAMPSYGHSDFRGQFLAERCGYINMVSGVLHNPNGGPSGSHRIWSEMMTKIGWSRGEAYSFKEKATPLLKSFNMLSDAERSRFAIFRVAAKVMIQQLQRR